MKRRSREDEDREDWQRAYSRAAKLYAQVAHDGVWIEGGLRWGTWDGPRHPEQVEVEQLHADAMRLRRAFLDRAEAAYAAVSPSRALGLSEMSHRLHDVGLRGVDRERAKQERRDRRREPSMSGDDLVALDLYAQDLRAVHQHDVAMLRLVKEWHARHDPPMPLFLHHDLVWYLRQLRAFFATKVPATAPKPARSSAHLDRLEAAIRDNPGLPASRLEKILKAKPGSLSADLKKLMDLGRVWNRGTPARPKYYV